MTVDWLTSAPIAHRGLHDLKAGVPENSLAAIEASCLAGLPIELDVRILGDRTVVVFHDKDLKRVANDLRRLSNLGKADISKISYWAQPSAFQLWPRPLILSPDVSRY